jgi:hypothetical protein
LPRPSPLLTPIISESSLPSPSVTVLSGSANSAGFVAARAAMTSRSLVSPGPPKSFSCQYVLYCEVTCTPSKSFFMMKLTTPATASEP